MQPVVGIGGIGNRQTAHGGSHAGHNVWQVLQSFRAQASGVQRLDDCGSVLSAGTSCSSRFWLIGEDDIAGAVRCAQCCRIGLRCGCAAIRNAGMITRTVAQARLTLRDDGLPIQDRASDIRDGRYGLFDLVEAG
jgi:hypothetical protein